MMHGYLALDADGALLRRPYWRNTNTGEAADASAPSSDTTSRTVEHRPPLPAILAARTTSADRPMTTLAGYVHWQLTDQNVLGIGDASGHVPIEVATGELQHDHADPLRPTRGRGGVELRRPTYCPRSDRRGCVGNPHDPGAKCSTQPDGCIPGSPSATPRRLQVPAWSANQLRRPRTGNVSAAPASSHGRPRTRAQRGAPELDLVTTPAGDLVAMVHCNNGASELNAWAGLFAEFAAAVGAGWTPRRSSRRCSPPHWTAPRRRRAGGVQLSSGERHRTREGRPLFLRTGRRLQPGQLHARPAVLLPGHPPLGMTCLQKERGCSSGPDVRPRRPVPKPKASAQRFLAAASTPPSQASRSPPKAAPGESRYSPHSALVHVRTELIDSWTRRVFRRQRLKKSSLTRLTLPASTPSSSATSPHCRWNERPSSTPDGRPLS